jgi:hypothetical protein
MGEDWIRKTEKTWRRSLRRKVEEQLAPPSLLEVEEDRVTVYPCQLVDPSTSIPVGCTVAIFQRSSQASIAVLHENRVIGSINGDAARDLKNLFEADPRLCRTLKAQVAAMDRLSGRLELNVAEGSADGQ